MSKKISTRFIYAALLLLLASGVLYGVDYLIFGRTADIAAGFLGNLAFLPVYVLFVTLMIERVLKERDRETIRQKLNMVIGVFFSEVGTTLLGDCLQFVRNGGYLAEQFRVDSSWGQEEFGRAERFLSLHEIDTDSRLGDLAALKNFLLEKRGFLLGLMENPNLLEHDRFTNLLWGVFHLLEELGVRETLDDLPPADLDHLSGDIKRAYRLLLREWVVYLGHLKSDYPFLFSLAVRTNPLNPEARPVITTP